MGENIISVIKNYYNYADIKKECKERLELIQFKENIDYEVFTIQCIESLIKKTNKELARHTRVMKDMATLYAEELGLTKNDRIRLNLIARLHDIGKVYVPLEILNKKEKLTDDEWKIIKQHSSESFNILSCTKAYDSISKEVLCHHERYDGTGYPNGLKGEEIPYLSRAISILDAYEVLINGRVYKKAVSQEEALKEIERCSGTQFDPKMVDAFKNMLNNKNVQDFQITETE